MGRKKMLKTFNAELEKNAKRDADILAGIFVQTALERNCECAVFIRDNAEEYSARAIAMSPANLAWQMAKAIKAMGNKAGVAPMDFMNLVLGILAEDHKEC